MNFIPFLTQARGKGLLVGGHRGHSSHIRENTIDNFAQLLATPEIRYIEIDVQLTRDGQTVIYHDAELSLQTDLAGMIRDYTLAELRTHFMINTVDEAVAWCKEQNMGIAFEIKLQPRTMWDDRIPVVNALVDVIRKYDFYEMCFVFGKDYEMLSMIKEKSPQTHIGLIAPFIPKDAPALMRDMDAFLYLNFVDQLSKELVDQLHSMGCLVDGSVVNTEEDLRKALELGVDMIESDHPQRILEALRRMQ